MDFELDPFDDNNVVNTAKPGAKFRPKPKLKPRKGSSVLDQSTLCTQPITTSENKSKNASETNIDGTAVAPSPDDNRSSELTNLGTEHLPDKESVGPESGLHAEASFGKSEGEKGNIVNEVELSHGLPSQTITDTPTTYSETSRNEVVIGTVRDSPLNRGLRACNLANSCSVEVPVSLDSLSHEEFSLDSVGDFHVGNRISQIEDGSTYGCLETQNITTELTSNSGQKTGKLQCKPKPRFHEEMHCATVPNQDDVLSVPSQTDNLDGGSLPAVPVDDIIDFSSMGFDDSISTDPALELPVNNEQGNLVETSHSDAAISGVHRDAVHEITKNRENGTTDVGLEHSVEHQQPSTSGQDNVQGRSLRQRRKQQLRRLLDEPEEEDLEADHLTAESPKGSAGNEDNHSDKEYELEEELEDERQDKRARRKSKKAVSQNEKPVRKRRKANEVSDPSTKKTSKKKFSHSTRRRGRFDKDWLKTADDEIELSDLSLRDIILLGEYREWTAKKNPETTETLVPDKRAASSSAYCYDNDDNFASEQGRDSNEELENNPVQDSGSYFNYGTHMKRTPRGRWTKQDTELFYKGLQQFGTDLSMITELFPGRTRNQIKLKYKKEEREHPMRLHEALTSRPKDHSQFELVVDRLKKAAAERKQKANADDVDGLLGDEPDDVPPETKEEEVAAAANTEQVEPSEVQTVQQTEEDEAPSAMSPEKSSDSEDERRWSEFKSDF